MYYLAKAEMTACILTCRLLVKKEIMHSLVVITYHFMKQQNTQVNMQLQIISGLWEMILRYVPRLVE